MKGASGGEGLETSETRSRNPSDNRELYSRSPNQTFLESLSLNPQKPQIPKSTRNLGLLYSTVNN